MISLFKPFVAIEHPVRYFFALFFLFFGGWHLADEARFFFGDSRHTEPDIIFTLAFLVTVLAFGSHFIAQKRAKRQTEHHAAG
ncbi:MAG: hypothetical protein HY088_04660 [Ignavibacteriales bacterium]|nr:hypothetical protein [Ignavibacteriales bacterium]